MSTAERRIAARANQRAAAFIRFQMIGDHEAMHFILSDSGESDTARLAFVTALASIAGSVATTAFGRDEALAYLQTVAESSAALSDADDIDRYFDGPPGD
jgi:membrane protein YqaA with SNARE-associated domain